MVILVSTTNIHNWIFWWFLPLVSLLFALFSQTTGVWRPSGGRQQEQVACVICETCPVASRTISEKVCSFHSSRINHASLSLHNHSNCNLQYLCIHSQWSCSPYTFSSLITLFSKLLDLKHYDLFCLLWQVHLLWCRVPGTTKGQSSCNLKLALLNS